MTRAQASAPAPAAPFAAMLRATVIPMAAAVPVIVAAFWITRATRGGLAALLGVSIAVVFLGVVIITFSGAHWLDSTAFGLSVLAVALIWQLCQVVAFMRLRQPLYDEPADKPDDELAQPRLP